MSISSDFLFIVGTWLVNQPVQGGVCASDGGLDWRPQLQTGGQPISTGYRCLGT